MIADVWVERVSLAAKRLEDAERDYGRELLEAYRHGVSFREIGRMLGVSYMTVSRVANRAAGVDRRVER